MEERRDSLILVRQILCCKDHNAFTICTNEECRESALMCCQQQCECQTKHINCHSKFLKDQFIQGLQLQRIDLSQQNFIDTIVGIYDNLIDKLSEQRINMLDLKQIFGVGRFSIEFIDLINFERQNEIDGKLASTVLREIKRSEKHYLTVPSSSVILYEWESQYKQFFQRACQYLSFQGKTQSTILNVVSKKQLLNWLPKEALDLQILHRASKYSFSNLAFHENCDGIEDTIVVAETEFGTIVGGYTPNKWDNIFVDQFLQDKTLTSFLFSLTLNEKYPLQKQKYATRICKDEGPMFGYWPTFSISNDQGRFHVDDSYTFSKISIIMPHQFSTFVGSRSIKKQQVRNQIVSYRQQYKLLRKEMNRNYRNSSNYQAYKKKSNTNQTNQSDKNAINKNQSITNKVNQTIKNQQVENITNNAIQPQVIANMQIKNQPVHRHRHIHQHKENFAIKQYQVFKVIWK